jgi:peroxiredoxin
MKATLLLAVSVLLAAGDGPNDRVPQPMEARSSRRDGASILPRPLETPASEVGLGDRAPNFSYQGIDGNWRRLNDLLVHGPVLLVFGADELTLRVLEHERERLMDLSVVPVAVVDMRTRAARTLVNRHDLQFTVLADLRGVIASQFNALDPATGRQQAAWFVVDAKRRVRGLGRRLPLRGYPTMAANALGLPMPNALVPASR